jgi:hypothetical protein
VSIRGKPVTLSVSCVRGSFFPKEHTLNGFLGYHSEWNLGSPGGWDYQRITQFIGKAVWQRINAIRPCGLELDFDHPLLSPVDGFVAMLLQVYREREGRNPGLIAVVAEEETLRMLPRISISPGISVP